MADKAMIRGISKRTASKHEHHLKAFGEDLKLETLEDEEDRRVCGGLLVAPRVRQYIKEDGTLVRNFEERKTLWLELFLDLVFVAVVASFVESLAHHPTWLLRFSMAFALIWSIWRDLVMYTNIFSTSDSFHRIMLLVQMIFVVLIGTAHPVASASRSSAVIFSLASLASKLLNTVLTVFAARCNRPEFRSQLYVRQSYVVIFMVCFAVAAALDNDTARLALWCVGVFFECFGAWLRMYVLRFVPLACCSIKGWSPVYAIEHLTERFGLFVIIVLGEIVGAVLFQASDDSPPTVATYVLAIFGMIIAFAHETIYFEIANSGYSTHAFRASRYRAGVWFLTHLLLGIAISVMAAGVERLLHAVMLDDSHGDLPGALLLSLGNAAALISLTLISLSHKSDESTSTSRIGVVLRACVRAFFIVLVCLVPLVSDLLLVMLFNALLLIAVAIAERIGAERIGERLGTMKLRRNKHAPHAHDDVDGIDEVVAETVQQQRERAGSLRASRKVTFESAGLAPARDSAANFDDDDEHVIQLSQKIKKPSECISVACDAMSLRSSLANALLHSPTPSSSSLSSSSTKLRRRKKKQKHAQQQP